MKHFLLISYGLGMWATSAEPLSVLDRYRTLRTIAGKGEDETRNTSWQTAFEGGNPRDAELSRPHDCGTDAMGRVYIADKDSNGILRVSADGSEIRTVAGTHDNSPVIPDSPDTPTPATEVNLLDPNGLHVFADGSFLILDLGKSKVRKVNAEGICETLFTYSAGFGNGRGLVATPDCQRVYFCGEAIIGGLQRVKRWSAVDGLFETLAELPASFGNIDLAPDGSLLVTCRQAHQVYRLRDGVDPEVIAGTGNANGNTVSGSPALTVALEEVRGVAVLSDGSYFLATHKGGDVWWVDLAGNAHLFLQGRGGGDEQGGDGQDRTTPGDKISEPRGLHVATNGDLLITTNDSGLIRAISNIDDRAVPEVSLSRDLSINWQAEGWRQTFLIETSPNLAETVWTSVGAITSTAGGLQNFNLEPGSNRKQFWRIRVPRLAGGE